MQLLRAVRKRVAIGVVGGSDFVKVSEQLTLPGSTGVCTLFSRVVYITAKPIQTRSD